MPRSLPRCREQRLEIRAPAFRHQLDCAIRTVAHPAAQPAGLRVARHEVAEADALHVAIDHRMKALHGFRLPAMSSSIVAIGDELVGGFTLDTNSHWLTERLRLLGHPVKRITVIRDRAGEIFDQIRRELADPEIAEVFCCGGLGPTPDDRTFAALAEALRRELIIWEETRARIERRVKRLNEAGLLDSPEVTEAQLRIGRIPAHPAHVLQKPRGNAPGGLYEHDRQPLV